MLLIAFARRSVGHRLSWRRTTAAIGAACVLALASAACGETASPPPNTTATPTVAPDGTPPASEEPLSPTSQTTENTNTELPEESAASIATDGDASGGIVASDAQPTATLAVAPESAELESAADGIQQLLTELAGLSMAAEHIGGYERSLFKHWVDADRDGCDARREVLLVEAVVAPTVSAGCSLAGGEWISRYDGLVAVGNGGDFDVDHLVPLAEAWQSGAHSWSAAQRELYANDLVLPDALIAVSASSNRSKGAKDPAEWLPPDAGQHCWYAAAWVTVKAHFGLTVDQAEAGTLHGLLAGCSDEAVTVGLPAPHIDPPAAPTSTVAASAAVIASGDCHPAYTPCLPNLSGDALNCGDLTSAQKPVAVLVSGTDPYRLDRDGDGRGCVG